MSVPFKKLKSNRGAAILFALLLLIVCVVAGSAALTSAASNVGRYTHLRQDQQRYLAVSSAVRLIREELCGSTYTASAQLTETYVRRSSTNAEGQVSWWTEGPDYAMTGLVDTAADRYDGPFQPWLEGQLDDAFKAQEVPEDWWDLAGDAAPAMPEDLSYTGLSVSTQPGADPLLSQVKWTLEMDGDYDMTAHFWLEETDADGKLTKYYQTVLTIPGETKVTTTAETSREGRVTETVTTQTVTVSWPLSGAVIRQS